MINNNELQKLQRITKLDFSDSELDVFAKNMVNILEMINKLQEVNCDNVEPLLSVCDMHQRLKEDLVNVSDISDDLFANVPKKGSEIAKEVKCFVVPKVIE